MAASESGKVCDFYIFASLSKKSCMSFKIETHLTDEVMIFIIMLSLCKIVKKGPNFQAILLQAIEQELKARKIKRDVDVKELYLAKQ